MSEHYYSKDPKVKSDPKEWSAELRGKTLRFKTDAGVFSKGEVDFGSRLLAEAFVMPETEGAILRCWLWLWSNWFVDCRIFSGTEYSHGRRE